MKASVEKQVEKMPQKDPPLEGGLDGASSGASKDSKKSWKWTRKKRKAVRLAVRGWIESRIAEELDVDRKTIYRWKLANEFRTAMVREAQEYTQRTRFKRVHESGIFADQFGTQLAKTFKALNDQEGSPSQLQLNALQTLTRGYGEFREHERADFGDNVQRFAGHFTVGAIGSTDPTASGAGAQSFKKFVEDNMDKIPKGLVEHARNPGEALVLATRALVQETDLLDKLYEEDKVEMEKAKAEK